MSSFIPNPKWRKTSKIINTRTITISRSIFFFVFFSRTNRESNISVYYTLCKHFSNSECWRSVRGKLYEPRQKPGLSPWKICLFEQKSGYAFVWVWVSRLKRVPWTLLFPLEGHSLFQLFFSFAIYFGKEMRFFALADQSNF